MRQFRLIFKPTETILERRVFWGGYYSTEIYPEKFDRDAQLLEQLLKDIDRVNRETE